MTQTLRTRPKAVPGIVHLGLGAFFRSHGAIYIQEAMANAGGDWGVIGVSLRSANVRDSLLENDWCYHAVQTDADGLTPQLIETLSDVLVAPENPQAVLDAMIADTTKIVSLTITEKGYCRGADGNRLDLTHPDIAHDLGSDTPRSAPGFIVYALAARYANGTPPFSVLCLDNLPENGVVTRQIILDFATAFDPNLAHWIEQHGAFPSTMVDRIVPATTDQMRQRLRDESGVDDIAAVFHEPFRQWVIEDIFVDQTRPKFEMVGAELVQDVEPFEHMKLRMLNGSHSALAYIGALAGHETVFDAITQPNLDRFISALWHDEVIPSISAPPNTDLASYAKALKSRYQNPQIRHLLIQIAMDGSQKLPQRILNPLFENLSAGRPYDHLLWVLAAWLQFVRQNSSGQLNDPLAENLKAAADRHEDTAAFVKAVLEIDAIFGAYPIQRIMPQLVDKLADIDRFIASFKTGETP